MWIAGVLQWLFDDDGPSFWFHIVWGLLCGVAVFAWVAVGNAITGARARRSDRDV